MKEIWFDENKIINVFNKGVESIIYSYKDINHYDDIVLLKKFKDLVKRKNDLEAFSKKFSLYDNMFSNNNIDIKSDFLENKRKKIDYLLQTKILDNEIKIYDEVFDNNNFIGYTMEKSNFKRLDPFDKKKNKIAYLKIIREKIRLLNDKDIFIGDFNDKNFLISPDKTEVKLCDLDNFKINNYDFDTKSVETITFNKKCNNEKFIDSYCFNIFTLSLLLNIYKPYLCYYLRDQKIPNFIATKENLDIIDSMVHLDNSYVPKYIIDNIK